MVKEKQLCFNCLKRGHRVGQCKSRVCTVAGCGRKHHTQLHSEVPVPAEKAAEGSVPETKKEPPTQPEQTTSAVTCTSFTGKSVQPNKNEVILSTAVVQVKDTRGCYRSCRVLLDSGSQSNFMSENFVKMLRLKLDNVRVPIVGINGERLTATQRTAAEVKSSCNESSWSLEFLIVPQVTGVLPLQKIDVRPWNIPPDLNLADPRFNIPARVDMLIGAELFFELLITERLKLDIGQPMLWRSELGWIVCGSYRSNQRPVVVTTVHCQPAETNLEDTVQRFWEQEEVPETTKLTTENEQCIEHFEKTHRRENGRFVVRLPFRNNVNQLGDTRHLAERRFLHLERRFVQSPELKQQYVSFINEYLALGHCRRVEHAGNEDHGYYLPHHAIVKPTSSTTRLRVVFDASARSDTNLSLNDVLITGPVLQDTDIVKMYRQIRVDESDSPYQKILWRDNCQEPLNTLELTTVTYGTSCAPFCATACLKQLADDEQTEFPIASKVARKDFYMDDVLSGDDELQRALECQYQLTAMLQRGGFRLHKWCANTPELLERIPVNEREVQAKIEDHNPNEVIKTLGLLWDPKNDVFLFRTRPQDEIREFNTKRTVLSDTAKIFDPLGLLEPVTVVTKLFIQELWARGVNWDERLTTDQEARWRRFTQDLQRINELQIPRRALADDATAFEIHGFSDASQKAYGACVYLRSVKRDGTAAMHLLSSKTRVAPLPKKPGSKRSGKPFTIPRAELCGAHLMAKLVAAIIEHLDLEVHAIVLWCDSQIVLCWLNKSPDTLEVFVGNKVREIKQLTDGFEWRYINTKQNPADLASRGLRSSELQQSTIWWHGPSMLQNADYTYQHIEQPPCNDYELAALVHVSVQVQPCELLTRYSDFRRLQRIVAYIYRFLDNCRQKDGTRRRTGFLTVIELRSATQKIISLAQLEGFADEFRMLRSGQTAKSKLLALDPFIDREGMLRVGGRLKHANISFGKKHQLLLPRSHHVTKILIAALHKDHLHIGQQGLLAIVRQRYWPVRAKCTIRQIVKKCVRCFRMNPPEVVQFMGALPDYRVNPSPVFYSTGIDYAGPFFVRQGRRAAKVKAYVALFICMSTKAIHLELVSDLTSAAFLAALHRFVGRRGCPEKLVSDNATNFKGAHSELQELYKLLQSQQLQDEVDRFCAAKEIQWSFIPPRSPNFGGIWEAGVKAAKSHLKVILCEASLTYEEMNTVLVQIEAILNSRPLTQISNDANDLTALTPGHFLVGRELTAVPEPSYGNVRVSSLSRWQHLQKLKQDFWARWSAEYLSELQPRSKWYKDKVTVRPGMLVVIREDNMAPQLWHLGRITEVTPGAEGLVRVVKIRTANGEVTRSVSKIAILPIEDNTFPAKE
ncbi:uncharacterized protein LOC134286283 [Aedes albopictus]|uniref:Integrase catalytic domain-containing protein n=1 Tax=Aedes albopictus TaxID=7160 RepID=A0ABM1ZKB0_AEDAL